MKAVYSGFMIWNKEKKVSSVGDLAVGYWDYVHKFLKSPRFNLIELYKIFVVFQFRKLF